MNNLKLIQDEISMCENNIRNYKDNADSYYKMSLKEEVKLKAFKDLEEKIIKEMKDNLEKGFA